jgi:hypothetical protein
MRLPRFPFAMLRALAHRNDTLPLVVARHDSAEAISVVKAGDCHAPINRGSQ